MIAINYFSNSRLNFFDIIFYFLNKIKEENKYKIYINILTVEKDVEFFKEKTKNLNLPINIIPFKDGFNYTEKLNFSINTNSKFSIKLDEDCIVNNFIWDYMIENTDVLLDDNNLLISPLLSTTIPATDEFIDGFLNEENKNEIHSYFLKQEMPNGLFGVNYEPLNEFTINSSKWDYKKYLNGLNKLNTETKGMHPMRISYNAQTRINDMILDNYEKIITKNDYSLFEIDSPYFTNNLFLIRTDIWKHIIDSNGGVYDEIPITQYRNSLNKRYLFIRNGYSIHTMYNTIYGSKNPWCIGGVDSESKEIEFVNKFSKKVII